MSEFLLRCGISPGLKKWVHTEELALQNNRLAEVNTYNHTRPGYLRINYVPPYPAAFVIKQTGQKPGADETCHESASYYWLNIYLNSLISGRKNSPCKWSDICPQEFITAGNKLFLSIRPDAELIRTKIETS